MPPVQYTQKRTQIFYTCLQKQSDIILHFLYFSAPHWRLFLPLHLTVPATNSRILSIRFCFCPIFKATASNPAKASQPSPPFMPCQCSKWQSIARLCRLRQDATRRTYETLHNASFFAYHSGTFFKYSPKKKLSRSFAKTACF